MFEQEIKDALKRANLDEGLYSIVKVEKVEDVEGAVANLKAVIQPVIQKEGDKRATSATQTSISNYEQKFNLKDGKPVVTTQSQTVEPPKNSGGEGEAVKLISELAKTIAELRSSVAEIKQADELKNRQKTIAEKLKNANIPTELHKRFNVSPDADDEAVNNEIEAFKTELISLKVAGMPQPGQGAGGKDVENQAIEVAKARNENSGIGASNVTTKSL